MQTLREATPDSKHAALRMAVWATFALLRPTLELQRRKLRPVRA
jgi:hypothetical protein